MKKVPIKFGNLANVLQFLGSMYRNPADAVKEHISNAVDEHLKRRKVSCCGVSRCKVVFTVKKDRVIIEYPYGMSQKEFQDALQRVANSVKREIDVNQIGRLGIGMFSFFQIGKKCTFFSKKDENSETIRVTLKEGSEEAEFDSARKKESIPDSSGMRIVISDLHFNPTKPRGPLSQARLQKIFAWKFDTYLRNESLEILLRFPRRNFRVKPLEIDLPRLAEDYSRHIVRGDRSHEIKLELYFDPSGKGTVRIRHTGVTVVEDISEISAYGLEESVYAQGYVMGFIDADFLNPLPARTGFEENADWIDFLDVLDNIRSSIEAGVEELQQQEQEKKLAEIQRKAILLAREILDSKEFEDLQLLEGQGPQPPEPRLPENGFDFVPDSIRISPGGIGTLPLKVFVPGTASENSRVDFSVNDDSAVGIEPRRKYLRSAEADENGLVTVHVSLEAGKEERQEPVILTAVNRDLKAEARIRIKEPTQTRRPITGKEREGEGINYEEMAFEDGPFLHSRFVSRIVQINTLNPDYKKAMSGTEQEQLAYAALMIGKETISFNESSGTGDESLEKLVTFFFKLLSKIK